MTGQKVVTVVIVHRDKKQDSQKWTTARKKVVTGPKYDYRQKAVTGQETG